MVLLLAALAHRLNHEIVAGHRLKRDDVLWLRPVVTGAILPYHRRVEVAEGHARRHRFGHWRLRRLHLDHHGARFTRTPTAKGFTNTIDLAEFGECGIGITKLEEG